MIRNRKLIAAYALYVVILGYLTFGSHSFGYMDNNTKINAVLAEIGLKSKGYVYDRIVFPDGSSVPVVTRQIPNYTPKPLGMVAYSIAGLMIVAVFYDKSNIYNKSSKGLEDDINNS